MVTIGMINFQNVFEEAHNLLVIILDFFLKNDNKIF